jgi:hypothetical protein
LRTSLPDETNGLALSLKYVAAKMAPGRRELHGASGRNILSDGNTHDEPTLASKIDDRLEAIP